MGEGVVARENKVWEAACDAAEYDWDRHKPGQNLHLCFNSQTEIEFKHDWEFGY